ncbi:unnamed protein product, partial [Effrenium voratum]
KESDCCAIRAFYSGSGAPATAGVTRVVFYLKRGTPRGEVDELEEKETKNILWLHLAEDLISYGSPEKYLHKGSGPRGQGGGGNAAGMTAGGGNDEDPDDEYEPVDVELPAAAMGAGTAPRPRSWRGMKRSLEENQQASRTATRTKIFVVWRADDKTEWGNKSNFPIVANERDLLTFHKARTSDTLYNERDILAYLTKQSGKELDYKRLTDKKNILFDAAKEVEIGNLEGSNAIRIITDEKELDKIRRDFPSRIMSSRFLLTKKAGEVGEDWKAKARWILLGHRDPDAAQLERYAPTPSSTTVMLCLQIIASCKYKLYIMDVSSAFGQSVITAVYGLVNAPAVWRKTVRRHLLELQYTELVFDPCLYYLKMEKGEKTSGQKLGVAGVVLLDVDDFCQGGNNRHHERVGELRQRLKFGKWKEVYLSSADYIGRTLSQSEDFEIRVSMERYIQEKLKPVEYQGEGQLAE